MSFELNPQQSVARKEANKWWNSHTQQTFEISGPAGSGKTSIVYELIKDIGLMHDEVLFMAYVGKATMALALKGNFAKTIHSTIYDIVHVPKLDEEGKPIQKNGRILTRMSFAKKDSLPSNIKLLVIDEGSMVDKHIAADILSYGLPVLVLGDLNQLPPVFGDPYFLRKPDVVLTQIMRQSEDNPIIWLSQQALKGNKIEFGNYGKSSVIPKEQINDNLLKNADIIICGKNETRQNINTYYRQTIMGAPSTNPMYGDKIVCRQNNWKLSIDDNINLINGLIGYIEDIYLDTYNGKSICIDFRPEFMPDQCFRKIPMDFQYLSQPVTDKTMNRFNFSNKFQYARAITCHLSQGSQYPKVLYYKERMGSWDYQRRLDYTALTRGEDEVVMAI